MDRDPPGPSECTPAWRDRRGGRWGTKEKEMLCGHTCKIWPSPLLEGPNARFRFKRDIVDTSSHASRASGTTRPNKGLFLLHGKKDSVTLSLDHAWVTSGA